MLICSCSFLGHQEQSLLYVLWYFFCLLLHQHQHQHSCPRRGFNVKQQVKGVEAVTLEVDAVAVVPERVRAFTRETRHAESTQC